MVDIVDDRRPTPARQRSLHTFEVGPQQSLIDHGFRRYLPISGWPGVDLEHSSADPRNLNTFRKSLTSVLNVFKIRTVEHVQNEEVQRLTRSPTNNQRTTNEQPTTPVQRSTPS